MPLLRLCRPYYAVPMSLAYLLTVYYAAGGELGGRWGAAVLSAIALGLVIAAGYVLNDLCDMGADRTNAPHRPLPAGQATPLAAFAMAAGLLAAGLILGAAGRTAFLAALTAVALALVLYDLMSKRLGLAKDFVVAALMTSIYPLAVAQAGGAAGPRAASLIVFPIWLFPTAFGYELLKDLRDLTGDAAAVGRARPIQRRPGLWRRVAAAAILLPAPLLILPRWLGCR